MYSASWFYLIYESEWKKYEPNIFSSYEDKGQVDWTLSLTGSYTPAIFSIQF